MRFFFWSGVALVVLILAAIAAPDFLKFAEKAKQSEAKWNLSNIFTCQVAYHGESGEYASTFEQLDWGPEGQILYAYYCGKGIIKNNKGEPMDFDPENNWPFKVAPITSKNAFTCMAIGNMDRDDTIDVWTIDDHKHLRNIVNDVIE